MVLSAYIIQVCRIVCSSSGPRMHQTSNISQSKVENPLSYRSQSNLLSLAIQLLASDTHLDPAVGSPSHLLNEGIAVLQFMIKCKKKFIGALSALLI